MGQRDPEVAALGARILAAAVTTTFAQQEFARTLGVAFPLLSDWDREVCAAYGARYEVWKGHAGLAKRALFVIDGACLVRYRWVSDDAMVSPELDEPVGVLRELAGAGTP